MSQSYLSELVEIAARIIELDQLENQLTNKRDWKAAKVEYEAQQVHFNKVRDEYVDELLAQDESRSSAAQGVEEQLTEFRAQADPNWLPALNYTRDNLLPYLEKEAAKDPRMRKAIKLAPFVAGGLAVVVYFAVRLLSGAPITEEIETRAGLQQRAAALEKVIRYDDWMGTRVRRGGWAKGILLWPIKPTDVEMNGAAEFVGLVLEGQQYANGCGSVVSYGDNLSDDQINMLSEVADYVQQEAVTWEDPPVMTVVAGLERARRC